MNLVQYLKDPRWLEVLKDEFQAPYFQELEKKLEKASKEGTVYPPINDVFSAFNLTPFEKVEVVIIGQDPYHGAGQAHGLCFSVQKGVKLPPSLKNIYKEIETDLGLKTPAHGFLESWAKEGVLLLNAHLTVEEGSPMAHKDIGWDRFTDKVIEVLNSKKENLVFMLWGSPAQNKAKNVDPNKHLLLKTVHPSPLSSYRGFFGCKHFSKCNDYLIEHQKKPIDWSLKA